MIESVSVRQRGAFDFETHYDNLCALQNSCPLGAVKAHLSEGVLDINGDRIRATDWVPILNTLRINKTLDFIAIRSYYQQTLDDQGNLDILQSHRKAHLISNVHSDKARYSVKRKTPAIRSKEITYRLCKALKECLSVTPALTCIELQGLPLRERDLGVLAKGLAKNHTLSHLSLEYSIVGDEGLETVCKGVKNSTSVSSLNFTGCGLSWKGADTLAKVIKHQAMKRHNEAWQDSLRYRRPDLDRMAGVRRITINSNPLLGDQGAQVLAEALKDDLWLKALDLQQCGLSDVGAKSLLDVLKFNTTIVVLDVRQNPMIDEAVIRSIMEQVMINSNGMDTEYKWVKATSPQDPSKAKSRKKRTKTLQSSFGKKTTIKVTPGSNGRRRTKSAGAVSRSLQPITAESVKPGPGMPWRTALRASRYRGYPPEHSPGKAHLYEAMDSSESPLSSPTAGVSFHVDYSQDTITETDRQQAARDRAAAELSHLSNIDWDPNNMKQIKVEFEQMRRRLQEEIQARASAEERVLELTVESRRLQHELEDVLARASLFDDDKVLESIETSFQQFHAFLDLLRDAGLGQLISMAGLDSAMTMPSFSRSVSAGTMPPAAQQSPEAVSMAPAAINISNPAQEDLDTFSNSKGMRPKLRPDNYRNTQDPTMQDISAMLEESGKGTAFDELYQRVLQETEGALHHAKGDISGGLTNGHRLHKSGPAGEGHLGHHSDQDLSEQSQRSIHSVISNHSRHSHKSVASNKSVNSHHSASHHSKSLHSASQANRSAKQDTSLKSQGKSATDKILSNGKGGDYSDNFEKTGSEVSEEIEEILEDLDGRGGSEEDDF